MFHFVSLPKKKQTKTTIRDGRTCMKIVASWQKDLILVLTRALSGEHRLYFDIDLTVLSENHGFESSV